jgi:hypothetical protein
VNPRENLLVTEVGISDIKDAVAQVFGNLHRTPAHRPVFILGGRFVRRPLQQLILQEFRFANAVGAEPDEHLPADATAKVLIRAMQKVAKHSPLRFLFLRQIPLGGFPFVLQPAELLVLHEVTQTIRYRVNQSHFFCVERSDGRRRHLAHVINSNRAHDLIDDFDVRVKRPRSLFETRRGKKRPLIDNGGLANIRILPAVRNGSDDSFKDGIQRGMRVVEQFLNLVKTIQFLRALLQR